MSLNDRLHQSLPATASADFNRIWLAGTASSISLWTMLLGNAWVVFKLSDSSAWVAVAVFASMFPFFLAPIGGIVADRFERRRLLFLTRTASVGGAALLFAIALTGGIAVWMVIAMALVLGVVRAAESPADQALLANVVPTSAVANAVTLSTTTRLGSRAVGPLLAGPLLDRIGVEGAYGVALCFSVLAFVFVTRIETRSRGGVESLRAAGDVVKSLGEGLSYVIRTGPVASIFVIIVAHCVLTMSFDSMLPGFADHELHSPTNGFTILSLGVGLGAFFGTLGLALISRGPRGMLFLGTIILSGIGPIFLATSTNIASGAAAATLMGASQAMAMALAAVFLQEVVHDSVRGRVMSLYLMSAGGLMAFANLGFGTFADWLGAPNLLLVPGLVFLAIVLASVVSNVHLRRIYGKGTLVPAAAAA
jgi:MFS family permease